MVPLVLLLIPVAFAVALPATLAARRIGRRLGALDGPGVAGQVKAPPRRVPNTGGVGIFLGVVVPMVAGLAAAWILTDPPTAFLAPLTDHLAGIRDQTPTAVVLLLGLTVLHIMGLVDDRRPLGPWIKLAVMALPAAAVATLTDTRLLMLLDAHAGGPWLSVLVTVLWFLVVTNAMNFMDNMDGLAAGVAAVAASCFLAAALLGGQWFIAATLALLVGSALGFLVFNFPRPGGAKVFMGDGGSLVLGFLLAFLTTRTTYLTGDAPAAAAGVPYALLMPLVILAVPLYDFASVVLLRLSQGRSPFVGDLQHFSHRLVARGLTRSAAVLVICGLTAATGLAGVSLASLQPWQAALVGLQTFLILAVIALFEYSGRSRGAGSSPP